MIAFFKKLWHGETDGLTAAAFIIGAASLAADATGVLRDRVVAGAFGAGRELDAYYAAFRVPDTIYNLIILGALTAGFIPVFVEYLERRGKREAWELAEQTLSVVGAALLAACAIVWLLADRIVPAITPGFDPHTAAATVHLTRIMLWSPFLLGLSAVMGGVLQATRRFFAFALAPVLYNVGIIFGAVFLAPRFGVAGVAWGVVLGALFHLLAQWSVAARMGLRHVPRPSFNPEGVRRILKLMLPRTAGLAVTQVNLIALLAIASSLPQGSVAVFNLANNIQGFSVSLIGVSFALAAFPILSRAAGNKDPQAFRQSLGDAGRKIFFLIVPVTILFLLLRAQIVRAILGQGKFDWNDTIRTASVLGWFSASLVAQALVPLLARAFYALQNTWTPLWIGLVSEATNIGLALALRQTYGITGLAIAFSAAAFVNMILLWLCLRVKQGRLGGAQLVRSAFKTVIASAALILVAYPLRQWLGTVYPLRTFWQVILQAGAASLGGLLAFVLVSRLLQSPELAEFVFAIKNKLWRKAKIVEGMEEVTEG